MTTNNINTGPQDRRENVNLQQQGGFEHQERIVEDRGAERQLLTDRITLSIYLVFGILEGLIGVRFLLRLIAANPANTFAHLVYQMTDLFLRPFATLVSNPASGAIVFEVTSLIAILVYGLISLCIVRLVRLLLYRTRTRTVSVYNKERQ